VTVTCTATFHQGEVREIVTERGPTILSAFTAAANALPVGLKVGTDNYDNGISLLGHWLSGAIGEAGKQEKRGHSYLTLDEHNQPVISIGWVTFTFPRNVRLWAVQAQVSTLLEREGWSLSRQVPTFYLDPSVQGITGPEGARAVAEDILYTVAGDSERVQLHVTVEPIY